MKITFVGAGSTVFVRNIIGDCMLMPALSGSEFALYDIDATRLEESRSILEIMKKELGSAGTVTAYCGAENRRAALRDADFVVCAIAVGGYDSTKIDFDIPNKYGLGQVIGDTTGVGGVMRALRTIPVLEEICADMREVCPKALFMNYSNPMAMLTGYVQRYCFPNTVGLCHSVQVCSKNLFRRLGMDTALWEGRREKIAGINHMAWLTEICDKDGNDLYPEIRRRVKEGVYADDYEKDLVRFDYIRNFGYYCTESSLHQAEYSNLYIKAKYPERLEKFGVHLDEYPARVRRQIAAWKDEYKALMSGAKKGHTKSREYGAEIMNAVATGVACQIAGNVPNTGLLLTDFPEEACVEVPCLVNATGIHPTRVGKLPTVCAAMCRTEINVHLLGIEAAREKSREKVYQALMLDPHTSSELDVDSIRAMADELLAAHGLTEYK